MVNIKSIDIGKMILLCKQEEFAMTISILKTDVIAAIDEEISRVASSTYSEDGASLYDGLRKTSRDTNTVNILMDEALAVMLNSVRRFMSADAVASAVSISIDLSLSERRARSKISIIPTMLISALAKIIISKYFSERQQDTLATKFDSLAAADMQTLQNALYEKLPPVYPAIV